MHFVCYFNTFEIFFISYLIQPTCTTAKAVVYVGID